MNDLLIVIGALFGVGMALAIQTIFKTRWGINFTRQIQCPNCGDVHDQVALPETVNKHCGVATHALNAGSKLISGIVPFQNNRISP